MHDPELSPQLMTLTALRKQFLSGETTPTAFLNHLTQEIEARDKQTQAYLSYDLEAALKAAENADLSKPLGGIPIAIKDNINVAGQPCTCASKLLVKNYTSPYNATVIEKLIAAGAIPFGRMNMDEFAMGSATENSAIQQTRNPHDPERIAGGSSGGSAASVGDRTAVAALGTDTGGSIRQPASHCGVVGIKPTYGRVSRYGVVAFASSLDQVGALSNSVDDAALILQTIAGHDPRDTTSLNVPVPDYAAEINRGVEGLKLGVPAEYFADGLTAGVRENVEKRIQELERQGVTIVPITLPHTSHAIATYYVIAPAEASSNLARFDGIRYGNRADNASDVIDLYHQSREHGFGAEVKRRIILGTFLLSSGYYDAYYTRAQKVRQLITRDFEQAFQKVDAIISPVSPTPARRIGACSDDPVQDYLTDIYTISANLAGIPAISVPCGTVAYDGAEKLPVGIQVLAPKLGESMLFRVAKAAENPI